MSSNLILNRSFLLLFSLLILVSCVKNPVANVTTPPGGGDDPPEITGSGSPNGNPVTKTIGASGGSVVSDDGKFTVTIPAGALSSSLDITIQPITNEAPGGIAGGYELLPSGTKFSIPVTLTYHYAADDINGSSPYFTYIATQDSTGQWTEDVLNRDLDTVANTVSITTPHFSSYVLASSVHFEFGQTQFKDGESNFIQVWQTLTTKDMTLIEDADGDLLPHLPIHKKQQVPNAQVGHWSIDDMGPTTAEVGVISGTGSNVTYTAPDNIDKNQTVKISAEVTGSFVAYVKKKKITFDKLILVGSVDLILDKMSFSVKIEYQQSGTNTCFIDNFTDGATLQVDIAKGVVTVPSDKIQNQNGSASPSSGPDDGGDGDVCTFKPGDVGMVNIISGAGTPIATYGTGPGARDYTNINLTQSGTALPTWTVVEPGGATSTEGGVALPGIPPVFRVVLRDSVQVTMVSSPTVNTHGYVATAKITVTPIH
jgi:hypothetical protein